MTVRHETTTPITIPIAIPIPVTENSEQRRFIGLSVKIPENSVMKIPLKSHV